MKIIIINGSPRRAGATSKILHKISNELSKRKDVNIQFVDILDLNILQCKGCGTCYKTGKCFIKDDAEKLVKDIYEADAIIIGSPTYASNVSGVLKTFIDRGHFVIEQLLYDKYAISVSTFENYGGDETIKVLNNLFTYSGALLSGQIKVKISFNMDPINKKISNKIDKISNRLYCDISNRKKYIFQRIKRKIIFSIGIKPFVKKKGNEYKGVLIKWRDIGIKV